ncbi:hypothetical protein [Nonomuraea sp. NPDC050786]|uniref:hypothetical protein n=1 Tax=Nonomuraea sp. NPDC050786 TaxID=3154840 RepID=UPI0034067256
MSHENPGDGKRCDHCNQPGIPYTYKGRAFSGLISNRGEKLCPTCNGHEHDRFVHDHANRPVQIWLPPELRGVDGRDIGKAARSRTRRQRTKSTITQRNVTAQEYGPVMDYITFAEQDRVRSLVTLAGSIPTDEPELSVVPYDSRAHYRVPRGTTGTVVKARDYPTPFPYVVFFDNDVELGVAVHQIERIARTS